MKSVKTVQASEKMLSVLKEALVEEEKARVVEKTIPMKDNWLVMWNDLEATTAKLRQLSDERDSKKKLFWGTVEVESGIFNISMAVDTDNKEIKVFKDEDED